jgi:hypothetical protein
MIHPSKKLLQPKEPYRRRNVTSAPKPTQVVAVKAAPAHIPTQYDVDLHPKLVDQAKVILQAAPITDEERANLWDIFHDSRTLVLLARKLQSIAVPDKLKRDLLVAKQKSLTPDATETAVDKTVAALQRVAQLPKNVLDISERHSGLAKQFIDANLKN